MQTRTAQLSVCELQITMAWVSGSEGVQVRFGMASMGLVKTHGPMKRAVAVRCITLKEDQAVLCTKVTP